MPEKRLRSPARLLAPLALLAFALAFFVVLGASSGTDDSKKAPGGSAARPSSESATTEAADPAPKRERKRASYTVKVGDSLGAIAEKTGVEVEALELLNPEVDAQALSPGQKLKLRE
ncbi:MAG: LysM peptidoglycan-binding domain-containing protein [Thermoleophilaceae bacterium]|nr:LysM peptidoglycan-binding domain-containing protein [Thermoleophilaceae bacterium]